MLVRLYMQTLSVGAGVLQTAWSAIQSGRAIPNLQCGKKKKIYISSDFSLSLCLSLSLDIIPSG